MYTLVNQIQNTVEKLWKNESKVVVKEVEVEKVV